MGDFIGNYDEEMQQDDPREVWARSAFMILVNSTAIKALSTALSNTVEWQTKSADEIHEEFVHAARVEWGVDDYDWD
jgi:hypothetical protein